MITIALAQHDFLVGDIRGNLGKALGLVAEARGAGAHLLLLPEMALTGYPPEDLLLRPGFLAQAEEALAELETAVAGIDVIVGHPWQHEGRRHNAVSWIREGRVIGRYAKQHLPNYLVFDEKRLLRAGRQAPRGRTGRSAHRGPHLRGCLGKRSGRSGQGRGCRAVAGRQCLPLSRR